MNFTPGGECAVRQAGRPLQPALRLRGLQLLAQEHVRARQARRPVEGGQWPRGHVQGAGHHPQLHGGGLLRGRSRHEHHSAGHQRQHTQW